MDFFRTTPPPESPSSLADEVLSCAPTLRAQLILLSVSRLLWYFALPAIALPLPRPEDTLALGANDPVLMLSAPIPATEKLLARAGVAIGDVDVYEVNEAFAVVPMAWAKRCGADEAKLNIHGGACALGHPLGATGAKLATTLVHTLQREEKRFGLLAICEGAGTANATLFERC